MAKINPSSRSTVAVSVAYNIWNKLDLHIVYSKLYASLAFIIAEIYVAQN